MAVGIVMGAVLLLLLLLILIASPRLLVAYSSPPGASAFPLFAFLVPSLD
jgi:uncharacterized integral membrane protein